MGKKQSKGTKISKEDWELAQALKKANITPNQAMKFMKRSWLVCDILMKMPQWDYDDYCHRRDEYYAKVPNENVPTVQEEEPEPVPDKPQEFEFHFNTDDYILTTALLNTVTTLNDKLDELNNRIDSLSGGVWTVRKLLLKHWEPEAYEERYGPPPDVNNETNEEEENDEQSI